MATYTTNLSLIKPAGTDKIRIAQINQNMDTIDAAIGAVGNTSLQTQVTGISDSMNAVEGGIAIVSNINTHVAIASGQYVYVKNHATLSEGLYRATQAIAANGTLTLSNVTPESAGGLNSLNEQIANNSIVKIIDVSIAVSGDTSWHETTGWQSIATDYKRFFVKARVHGALANSAIIEKTVLQLLDSSNEFSLSAFWNDNNLGEIKLVGNNGIKYYANAKTKDFAFDIIVYGIN